MRPLKRTITSMPLRSTAIARWLGDALSGLFKTSTSLTFPAQPQILSGAHSLLPKAALHPTLAILLPYDSSENRCDSARLIYIRPRGMTKREQWHDPDTRKICVSRMREGFYATK